MRHTPGPWKIRAERYRFIHVYANGGGIAHLDTVDGEGAANARLIAAAPDLLNASRAALHYMRIHKCADQTLVYDLEAAIAAAEKTT